MPYEVVVPNKHPSKTTQGGWQLNISIAPLVLRQRPKEQKEPKEHKESKKIKTAANRIEDIKAILKKQLAPHDVHALIFISTNEADYWRNDDSAERPVERGKEICIEFSDAVTRTTEQYKELLLHLWKAFQDNSVPFVYMHVPGAQAIPGPHHLPTPFSFTSFALQKTQPLSGLEFTEEDLKKHGIVFSPIQNFQNSRAHFYQRQRNAKPYLEGELKSCEQKSDAKTSRDQKSQQTITPLFKAHSRTKSKNNLPIDWAAYIPNYTPQHLETLVHRNPAGMQWVYRRIVLLEQDRKEQIDFEKQYLEVLHPRNEVLPDKDHVRIEPLAMDIDNFIKKCHSVLQDSSLTQLQQDLYLLHNDLSEDLIQQRKNGQSDAKIKQSTAYKIAHKTSDMLRDLDEVFSHPIAPDDWRRTKIQEIVQSYQNQCTEMPASKIFLKAVAVTASTIIGFLLGALIGAGIGIAAGAWSGLGAAISGTMGLTLGAAKGASAGLAVGASLTGLASGLAAFGLIGRDPLKKIVRQDMEQIAKSAEALVPKMRA